jgi:hypothetical protein
MVGIGVAWLRTITVGLGVAVGGTAVAAGADDEPDGARGFVGVFVGVAGFAVDDGIGVETGRDGIGVFVDVVVDVAVGDEGTLPTGVFVEVLAGVVVGVPVGWFVGVPVGELVAEGVDVAVGVMVKVCVGVTVSVTVLIGVWVEVPVGVVVTLLVGVGVLTCGMIAPAEVWLSWFPPGPLSTAVTRMWMTSPDILDAPSPTPQPRTPTSAAR